MKNQQFRARMMLIASMLIFGTIGIFRRYIPLSSGMLAMSRGFIGSLFLFLILYFRHQKLDFKAIRANLKYLLLSGCMIGFNWILLFESYNHTTVATATLCYYMQPVFVTLLAPFVLKDKMTLRKLICVIVALAGMVLVSGVLNSGITSANDIQGILLGLGAALLYACVILVNQKIRNIPAFDKSILQLASAAVVLIPYIFVAEKVDAVSWTPQVILMLAIVGIVHTGIAYALYFGCMDSLKAQTVALFSYIDPIVAVILSALLLQESMGIATVIGAVLILGSAIVNEISPEPSTSVE